MATTRRLLTNASKGELDPLVEGRPDLAAYFEGGSEILNFNLLRQGGLDRRVGTRFIREVKSSSKDTILLPHIRSSETSYIVEAGDLYYRFYKAKGSLGVEIVSPYTESRLRQIHYTQVVDVMFTFQVDTPQQRLSRVSDTVWTNVATTFNPPPTFESDTDISGGSVVIQPGATTGTGVGFSASGFVFQAADVGRNIIYQASRAVITAVAAGNSITCNIIDAFPSTAPIPAGQWFLGLSPQAALTFTPITPVGALGIVTAPIDTFRTSDVGKYIVASGGLIRLTRYDTTQQMGTEILVSPTIATPGAGTWSLEVPSWSPTNGYARTGEFVQGRLCQASTRAETTTVWLSATDDYDNYAPGITADRAIEFTIASRQLNQVEWVTENTNLFVGTTGAEFLIKSSKADEPLGGDQVPFPQRIDTEGSSSIQPIVIEHRVIMVDSSGKRVFAIAFDINEDTYALFEITGASSHIMGRGVRPGQLAFAKHPDPRIHFIRQDGQLVTLTYFPKEKVIGFTRYVTDGTFEAVAVIPQTNGRADSVYVVVKRIINGNIKRYIEVLDEDASELSDRAWTSLQTDCAKVYDLAGVPTTVLTGLDHLEGKTVNVITDGSFRGTKVVSAGQITLDESANETAEIGLDYVSRFTTMRPGIEGSMVEGLPRAWIKLWARVKDTIGGKIMGEWINYPPPDTLSNNPLRTGDVDVTPPTNWNTDGRITIEQTQPYPMTLLAIFGDIEFGDHG